VLVNHVEKESCMARLKERLAREEGFTLIELLVVIIIIAILLAIAIPSYLGFRDKANQRAAQADVRSAIPAAEGYYSDYNNYLFDTLPDGTTTTDPLAALREYDSGLKTGKGTEVGSASGTASNYCISAYMGGYWAFVNRPPDPAGTTDQERGEVVLVGAEDGTGKPTKFDTYSAADDPCS